MHISRYAVSQERYYDHVRYNVDLDKLRDKRVVEIMSNNSGIFCKAYAYPAEDLSLGLIGGGERSCRCCI
ncbi:MAG: hypothetical protein QW680_13505 [Pyrobaculum sp.]